MSQQDQSEKPRKTSPDNVVKVCSICEGTYTGFGNNAAPFPGRCCNECNTDLVIPARLRRMTLGKGW